ncbi:MAG: hypothetical protein Phog2KO_33770 [Phototrophicaceae bacterium]
MSSEELPKPDETVVMSADNPLLKRILNKQSNTEADEHPTDATIQEISFSIRGMTQSFTLKKGQVIKLGRYDLTKDPNELDLNPYGASDRGVSHNHAEIHMDDNGIYITDLASTNGTFIHGKRIDPNTATLLQKEIEILLGRLKVIIKSR